MGVNSGNLCRSLALHVPTASSTRCSQRSRKPPNTKEKRTQESIAPNKLRVATLVSQQQTQKKHLTLDDDDDGDGDGDDGDGDGDGDGGERGGERGGGGGTND